LTPTKSKLKISKFKLGAVPPIPRRGTLISKTALGKSKTALGKSKTACGKAGKAILENNMYNTI